MFPSYTPWKYQITFGFLDFFRMYEMGTLSGNGLIELKFTFLLMYYVYRKEFRDNGENVLFIYWTIFSCVVTKEHLISVTFFCHGYWQTLASFTLNVCVCLIMFKYFNHSFFQRYKLFQKYVYFDYYCNSQYLSNNRSLNLSCIML